jgi:hypothetical protein
LDISFVLTRDITQTRKTDFFEICRFNSNNINIKKAALYWCNGACVRHLHHILFTCLFSGIIAFIAFIHLIMAKINPFNSAKLLIEDISLKYTKSTSINAKEIELKDHILGNIVKTNISATYMELRVSIIGVLINPL